MLRSFICLLLAISSLSHYIHCEDNATQSAPEVQLATYIDSWVNHNYRVREPVRQLWLNGKRDYEFYLLNHDTRKDYIEVTKTLTRNANGHKTTCQYKFHADDKDVQIIKLFEHDAKDTIALEFSTAASRSRNIAFKTTVNFMTCNRVDALEAPGAAAAAAPVPTDEKREEIKLEAETAPLQGPTKGKTFTSDSKSLKASCQLSDNGKQLTCTQKDWHDKVLMNNVKYDLPSGWSADWWAIHNANAGALLVYFASCPHDYCSGYAAVRLTAKGVDAGPFTHNGMDLECPDMSDLSFEATDHEGGWTCIHVVCPESLYKRMSEVKVETIVHFRQQCLKGDAVN